MRADGGAAQARSRWFENRARAMEVARPRRAARNLPFPGRFIRRVRRARRLYSRGDEATIRSRAEESERRAKSFGGTAGVAPEAGRGECARTGFRFECRGVVAAGFR